MMKHSSTRARRHHAQLERCVGPSRKAVRFETRQVVLKRPPTHPATDAPNKKARSMISMARDCAIPAIPCQSHRRCCYAQRRLLVNRRLVVPVAMLSRTSFKQQLMREQLLQLEEKKRLPSASPTSTMQVPLPQPSPLNVQVPIPKQVLMVHTKLENPSPYHVREIQQQQVREYLSQSSGWGSVDPSPGSSHASAASTEFQDILTPNQNSYSDSVANNLLEPSLTVSVDTFQDILTPNQNSYSDSVANNLLEPSLTLSVDTGGFDSEADLLEMLLQSPLPEEERACAKDRAKKDNHNRIERNRRDIIDCKIKELRTLLPKSNELYYDLVRDLRQSKGCILTASVNYVRCLKNEVGRISDLEGRMRAMDQLNKKLLLRIQNLELQLQAQGLPVPVPTWTPSTPSELSALVKEEPQHHHACSAPVERPRLPHVQYLRKEEPPATFDVLEEGGGHLMAADPYLPAPRDEDIMDFSMA
ncbi:hypothetical protein JTE90_026701 [Oedothorax gibbosus]|uniref:BHLH domain-containing protein n=1 Tax=Oedothorax gibbosus TaxID=931172 RepID=A0AAV6V1Z4_9ARAC|nr:hypothetical protein JTE90_026701 [Oedothorax gibbosus]